MATGDFGPADEGLQSKLPAARPTKPARAAKPAHADYARGMQDAAKRMAQARERGDKAALHSAQQDFYHNQRMHEEMLSFQQGHGTDKLKSIGRKSPQAAQAIRKDANTYLDNQPAARALHSLIPFALGPAAGVEGAAMRGIPAVARGALGFGDRMAEGVEGAIRGLTRGRVSRALSAGEAPKKLPSAARPKKLSGAPARKQVSGTKQKALPPGKGTPSGYQHTRVRATKTAQRKGGSGLRKEQNTPRNRGDNPRARRKAQSLKKSDS